MFLEKPVQGRLQQVSLSNNTIQRRISKMSMDVKEHVLTEIKASPLFSFQVDESTDVSKCWFMFSVAATFFFQYEDLQWENVCVVCTDRAPAMLGSKSGFQLRVKKLAPQAKDIHYMIHQYALSSKTRQGSA